MRNFAFVVVLAGCGASASDIVPPTLNVTSPDRGTLSADGAVTVAGNAKGGKGLHLTVNGTDTPINADGSFSAALTLAPGMDIIETHLLDAAGNDLRDVRAVLTGELATADGSVAAPVGARAGMAALGALGNTIANVAADIDYTTAAKALNPIYNNTGCLGAVIDITDVGLSDVHVGLTPKDKALATEVTLDNVVVHLKASFRVAGSGGSTTITLKASKAHVKGDLGVSVSGGKLVAALPNAAVTLDGFSLDIGGIPGALEDLVRGKVQDGVQSALTSVVRSKVPPIASTTLAQLLAKPYSTDVLGHTVAAKVTPTHASVDLAGLYVAVDTNLTVEGGEAGMYLSSPSPIDETVMSTSPGFGLAIAGDGVNQLLGGMWAAKALDQSVAVSALPVLGAILDPQATNVALQLKLPPTLNVGDDLQLALGDAIVVVQDASGATLQQMALTVSSTLKAGPTQSGKLSIDLGTPTIYAQVLTQSDDEARQLTDEQVEGLAQAMWSVVGPAAAGALTKLPMPSLDTVQLGEPKISANAGFIVGDIAVP